MRELQNQFKKEQAKISISKWVFYLLIGWSSSIVALFLATGAGSLLIHTEAPEWLWKFIQGVIFTLIMVIVMMYLQRKMGINIWSFIRLTPFKKGILYLFLGASIPVLLIVAGIFIGHLLGWITVRAFHFSSNLLFAFILNTVIAFLYEAFPEEIMYRGYLYQVLRSRMVRFLAVFFQLVLFVLFPVTVTGLQYLFGIDTAPITIDYIILIFCFGLALQLTRLLTNNLWTSIGFHLAYLEIARFIVQQDGLRFLEYEELYPGIGTVFLLLFMIILISVVIGTVLLFILNKTKQ